MPPTRATTKKSSSVLLAAGASAAQLAVSALNDASKNEASSSPKTMASSSKKKTSQSRISPRRNNSPPTEKNEKKRKRGESATSATSAKAHASSSTAPSESDLKVTGRPKRRAASSVRFGSYKDIEKVDFSLLVDSVMEVSNKSYYASASKKQSAGTRKATTQTSSKKKKTGQVKRSRLMASSTQSMTKAAAFSENTTTSHQFKHATTNSTIHGGKINLNHVLPPILIEACSGSVTPGMLRSLSSSTKIDIFNRKTGRIMKGEDGVTVKDLTQALRNHAEYEPIIPCPHLSKTSSYYREARTSKNARVSKEIQPQTKIRDSKVQGRNVIVTAGPHKGLYGKIDGCLPGNWYLVANALKEDELNLDMVIHSKNLKLVSKRRIESEQNISSSLPVSIKQSDDLASKSPIMNLMQSLKVQMLELEKGKNHLEMMASQKGLDTKDKMQENAPQQAEDIVKALANASNALEGAQAELQKKSFLCEILDLSVKKNDR
mmetsp:Transcript_15787/g.23655  ORF Transcript_15787/g.23655 Transcript_15787/m.23655 type:complete len:491 (-) Transcript_15787:1920-3392(-)